MSFIKLDDTLNSLLNSESNKIHDNNNKKNIKDGKWASLHFLKKLPEEKTLNDITNYKIILNSFNKNLFKLLNLNDYDDEIIRYLNFTTLSKGQIFDNVIIRSKKSSKNIFSPLLDDKETIVNRKLTSNGIRNSMNNDNNINNNLINSNSRISINNRSPSPLLRSRRLTSKSSFKLLKPILT